MANQVYVQPYTYKGCFKDSPYKRAVPNYLGGAYTVAACKLLALKNKYDTFALQNGLQCWAGTNPNYGMYGSESGVS